MIKLSNGRIEVGPDQERIIQEELNRLNEKLAILTPKVEQDLKESRERHKKLWNY